MSCELKNEKCPVQIQCLFPTAANDTRPFSLYFYSSQGSQERVLSCAYNGNYRCFPEKGFETTHAGFNDVTITFPDTFAKSKGFFGCQKGDIHMAKNCLYHPTGICNTISSTESGIGLGTTTKSIDFPSTTEQVGNKDVSPAVIAGVIVGLIVVLALIMFISCWLSKKYRCCSRFKEFPICIAAPFVIAIEKFQKYFLGKESKGNRVNETKTNPASFSVNGGNMKTNGRIHWGNVLTTDPEKANGDQEHASTGNKISSDSSGLQPAPSPFATTCSDGSDKPLLKQ